MANSSGYILESVTFTTTLPLPNQPVNYDPLFFVGLFEDASSQPNYMLPDSWIVHSGLPQKYDGTYGGTIWKLLE